MPTFPKYSFLRQTLLARGRWFWANLVALVLAADLGRPLLEHESTQPVLLQYSLGYLLFLIGLGIIFTGILLWIVLSDAGTQCRLFLTGCAVLATLEATARFILRHRHWGEEGSVPAPYVMFMGRPGFAMTLNNALVRDKAQTLTIALNPMGFHEPKRLSKEKPPGEFRVFLLGGSTVLNGHPTSETISGQLERRLHQTGHPAARVYNCGVTSSVSGMEMSLMLHTLSGYRPDLVLMYNGGNDLYEPYYFDPRPGYPYNFVALEAGLRRIRDGDSFRERAYAFLFHNLRLTHLEPHFANSVQNRMVGLDTLRKTCHYGSAGWEEAVAEAYLGNLDRMCHLARGFDFRFGAFLQPMVHLKSPLVGQEPQCAGALNFQKYILRQYARTRVGLDRLNRKWGDSRRCYFVDLSRAFENTPRETFWDWIHIDNPGNKVIAEKIYGQIQATGLLLPPSRSSVPRRNGTGATGTGSARRP